jgi:hypothetical protein
MEPRWNKISSAVVESLEAAIAIEQNKVILLKIAQESLKDEKVVQMDGEGKIEFFDRQKKFDQMKNNIPKEINDRTARMRLLMDEYELFMGGSSILGEKTGKLEKLENLFRGGSNGGDILTA